MEQDIGIMASDEANNGEKRLQQFIYELRQEKRSAKSLMTRLLNRLAALISDGETERNGVRELMERIEQQKDDILRTMDRLERAYREGNDLGNAAKLSDEADALVDHVDRETSAARSFLASSRAEHCGQARVPTERQTSKEPVEVLDPAERQQTTSTEDGQERQGKNLGSGNGGVGAQPETILSSHAHGNDSMKQLERIKIPVFGGNKMDFQRWYAAFTSCVDLTPLTPQFKMLRLEECLVGEAAETIRGLGYSLEAYETAKARLVRKYGGTRRQVQSHLEELKKLRPLRDNNAKELEMFADVLERAVITLKENGNKADLEGGALYTIVVEKIPERLLTQYYRWIIEHKEEESLVALKNWVAEEAEYQTQAAEIKHGIAPEHDERSINRRSFDGRRGRSYASTNRDKRERSCGACGDKHPIWKCEVFRGWTAQKRWDLARKCGLCFRCLGDDHLGKTCSRDKGCSFGGCSKRHHPLLHYDNTTRQRESDAAEGSIVTHSSTMETIEEHKQRNVALRTVPVILKHGRKRLLVNCFLDEGSDTSYVNEDVAEELGFHGTKEPVTISVANDQRVSMMSATLEIGLESVDGTLDTEIIVKTSNKICGGMKPTDWVRIKHNWSHLKNIPFPKLPRRGIIDVLLGSDHYHLLFPMREVRGGDDEPSARLCPLGWTAIGRIGSSDRAAGSNTAFLHTFRTQVASQDNRPLDELMKKFWDLETIGITPECSVGLNPEEKLALRKVSESFKFDGERYEVAVPWRSERPSLPENRGMAERRLRLVERKLAKDTTLATAYQTAIEDYLKKGYIREVPEDERKPESEWFLPHFPVVRPDKATTKVRIVFDGSATHEGKSLNSEALPGPKLQSNIFDILVKFRKESVVLVGDVSQMYHQLVLKPEDRPFHRFLWRNCNSEMTPKVYEFIRFIFGGCYCPFCAQYTWQMHARMHKDEYPLAANAVLNHCYMDDLMPSAATLEEVKETRRQLTQLGDMAGFHIRKWVSNRPGVVADIPVADRATEINLDNSVLPTTKTLGVLWRATDDAFSFHCSVQQDGQLTKRSVLKKTATVYDPLGFLSPYTIRAKLLIQRAWLEGIDWDDPLPANHLQEWATWFMELESLGRVEIPRCLKDANRQVQHTNLHTFTDASEKAYAANVYSRQEYADGTVTVRLIASKTCLAPLKALSIPRLELMGAIIGLRLTSQVCKSLQIEMSNATFWVDSLNVAFWIRGQSREYKPFVAHRVGEIHDHSSPDQWRYVPTKQNPADLGTRGLTVPELAESAKWWTGPEFLVKPEAEWPDCKFDKPLEATKEMKSAQRKHEEQPASYATMEDQHGENEKEDETTSGEWRLDPARYSKWYKAKLKKGLEIGTSLVRVRGWVQRFIANCHRPEDQRESGELTPVELRKAEQEIIKETQGVAFSSEISALKAKKPLPRGSPLLPFSPIMIDGMLRSNTRLRNAEELPEEVRFPVILPKKNHVTGLIVKFHHEGEGHQMGVNFTISHLREKYLVIHVRQEVKRAIRSCAECKLRFHSKPASQQMAPLPQIRLQRTSKPFVNCAVDFGGPYLTIQGRGRARAKRYLCLFLCLQTHCCHLEMATSLDTGAFLNALVRMAARRGWPANMLSDNGTNFVGAAKEIKELVAQLDRDQLQRTTANQGVTWHWNPPAAPHFGGVFESMIKSAKRAIRAVLEDADVNDEELQTTFIGVESLLNSRPLTALSDDPNDEPVLTPNHFLIGQMGGDFIPESVDTTTFSPRRRWRRVQELTRHVWRRWMREYLPHIGSRHKWFLPTENLKEGDIVTVIEPNAAR